MAPIRQSGFSLIESLVAVVILATGMLGIAALYVESLRSGQTAVSRTKAINLAADMADRIRANRAGSASYSVDQTPAGAAPAQVCVESGGLPAADCTPAEMAAFDIWLWKTMVGNTADADAMKIGLPNGRAEIIRNAATTPTTFTIRISWSEKDDNLNYALSLAI